MPQAAATATAAMARATGDAVMEEVDVVAWAVELPAADLEALVREPQGSVVATGGGN